MKSFLIRIEADLHRKLKKNSYENERSMNSIVTELLEDKYKFEGDVERWK